MYVIYVVVIKILCGQPIYPPLGWGTPSIPWGMGATITAQLFTEIFISVFSFDLLINITYTAPTQPSRNKKPHLLSGLSDTPVLFGSPPSLLPESSAFLIAWTHRKSQRIWVCPDTNFMRSRLTAKANMQTRYLATGESHLSSMVRMLSTSIWRRVKVADWIKNLKSKMLNNNI